VTSLGGDCGARGRLAGDSRGAPAANALAEDSAITSTSTRNASLMMDRLLVL
jgi:hypothetical protein